VVKIANDEPPTEEVINLRNQGKGNDEIVSELSQKGFTNQQISEAINQADIKGGVEGEIPPARPEAAAPEGVTPPETGMKPSVLTGNAAESEIPVPVPSPGPAPAEEPKAAAPQQGFGMPQVQQPAPQEFVTNSPQPSMDVESVQEIVESIIDERWQEVVASVGDITIWKSRVEDDITSIKQEILRLDDRLGKLQASIIGKVDEYQKGISKVSSEMEALEKVFSKIMEPLTTNIKELQRITQNIKKKD
jgi:hypothetical protein